MKLTPRLQAVVDRVPSGSRVVDIGTDHAYIPVYLLMNRKSPRVIATDSRPGPLLAAEETLELFNLTQMVELRLGDGLNVLRDSDSIDVVIIAGLGGETIISILQQAEDRSPLFILQPMTQAGLVRKWLVESGFALTQEDIAEEEGTFYEVIVARWTGEEWSGDTRLLAIGPRLVAEKHPLLSPMLRQRLERLEAAIAAAKTSSSPGAGERASELERQALWVNEVISWL